MSGVVAGDRRDDLGPQAIGTRAPVHLRKAVAILIGQFAERLEPGRELDFDPQLGAAVRLRAHERFGDRLRGHAGRRRLSPAFAAHRGAELLERLRAGDLVREQVFDERREGERMAALRGVERRLPEIGGQARALDQPRKWLLGHAPGSPARRRRFRGRLGDHEVGVVRGKVERRARGPIDLAHEHVRRAPDVVGVHGADLGVIARCVRCLCAPWKRRVARMAVARPRARRPAQHAHPRVRGAQRLGIAPSLVAPQHPQHAQPVRERVAGARSRRRSGWGSGASPTRGRARAPRRSPPGRSRSCRKSARTAAGERAAPVQQVAAVVVGHAERKRAILDLVEHGVGRVSCSSGMPPARRRARRDARALQQIERRVRKRARSSAAPRARTGRRRERRPRASAPSCERSGEAVLHRGAVAAVARRERALDGSGLGLQRGDACARVVALPSSTTTMRASSIPGTPTIRRSVARMWRPALYAGMTTTKLTAPCTLGPAASAGSKPKRAP